MRRALWAPTAGKLLDRRNLRPPYADTRSAMFLPQSLMAFVVGLAACLFLSVLAVISNAVITNTAEKSGLVPMSVGVIAVALLVAKQLSLPLSTVAKIFLRSC